MDIWIPGNPAGQPRVRFGRGHSYHCDTKQSGAWRQCVKVSLPNIGTECIGVIIDVFSFFKRPKSHYRPDCTLKKNAPMLYVKKPDKDNIDKLIFDEMTKQKLYKDDANILGGGTYKFWVHKDPGCLIWFNRINNFMELSCEIHERNQRIGYVLEAAERGEPYLGTSQRTHGY